MLLKQCHKTICEAYLTVEVGKDWWKWSKLMFKFCELFKMPLVQAILSPPVWLQENDNIFELEIHISFVTTDLTQNHMDLMTGIWKCHTDIRFNVSITEQHFGNPYMLAVRYVLEIQLKFPLQTRQKIGVFSQKSLFFHHLLSKKRLRCWPQTVYFLIAFWAL